MAATAVLSRRGRRPAADHAAGGRTGGAPGVRAAAYQRVLHQLARRELRVLAELATWAEPSDARRTGALARHADLIGRILLQHHDTERALLWPALVDAVPERDRPDVRRLVEDWSARCARIDHELRDVATAARQWTVAGTAPARDAFAMAVLDVADAVETQVADEERALLPLLSAHLPAAQWRRIARAAPCRLSPREQMAVLGMALEDLGPTNRTRLLAGLPLAVRLAWRWGGARGYRAAVVSLRGAPPAR